MKKIKEPSKKWCEKKGLECPCFSASKAVQTKNRKKILTRLFPEGINEVKIWNGLVVLINNKEDNEQLSVERFEDAAETKFKLKQRIIKYFPKVGDKMCIINNGDMDMLRKLTQSVWSFADSHKIYAHEAVVLHGRHVETLLLDWAAQAVVTMLLRHIKASI